MKAKVYVTLKRGVLDPQGKAIHHAVQTMGYHTVADVRQGKYFELELSDNLDEAAARAQAEKLAHDLLANIVIEDYRVELEK
jgi:phosphoribosylformylglycinamidine synthase subunit PurS